MWRGQMWGWVLAAGVLSGLCSTMGCAEGDQVVVEVRLGDAALASELDRIVIWYAASTAGDPMEVCAPSVLELGVTEDPTDQGDSLPYRIRFEPGSRFHGRLFLRVEGFRDGVLRYRTERMVSLQGGAVSMTVTLTGDCLNRGLEPGRMCLEGRVLEAPGAAIFDEGEYVVEGLFCGGQ